MIDKDRQILVVDDIGPARQTVINILQVLGYKNSIEAGNGRHAWEQLQANENVGLVISDWKMPEMNGIDLLYMVRNDPRWRDIPFFLVTSKSETEDVAQATDMGATGYMVKPLNIHTLREKLESLSQETPSANLKKIIARAQEMSEQSKFDKAKALLVNFLNENPDFESRVLFEIGLILEQEGNWIDAEKIADKALKKNPDMSRALFLKARTQGMQNKWNQAIETMHKALEINSRNSDYLIFMGMAYLEIMNLVQARSRFMMALNTFPKDINLKQTIWNTYLKYGLVEQVQIDFGAVLFESLTADTLNNMAVVLRKKNMLREALAVYKQALKKDTENPRILFNMATAYFKKDNKFAASKHLKRALDIKPDFTEASELLESIADQEGDQRDRINDDQEEAE